MFILKNIFVYEKHKIAEEFKIGQDWTIYESYLPPAAKKKIWPCPQPGLLLLDQNFIKLADNQVGHKISDELKNWPDQTIYI